MSAWSAVVVDRLRLRFLHYMWSCGGSCWPVAFPVLGQQWRHLTIEKILVCSNILCMVAAGSPDKSLSESPSPSGHHISRPASEGAATNPELERARAEIGERKEMRRPRPSSSCRHGCSALPTLLLLLLLLAASAQAQQATTRTDPVEGECVLSSFFRLARCSESVCINRSICSSLSL